jgi:hypothetical protein
MRTPHTFQIGSTTYTTRQYCNSRGITDNATILKIQWRINTYIRNHTIQQTIEELDRLIIWDATRTQELHKNNQKIIPNTKGIKINPNDKISTLPQANGNWLNDQRQEKIGGTLTKTTEGTRPWQGTQKERIIAQRVKEAREAATSKMITQQQNGETATKAIEQRELLKQSEWMEQEQKIKAIYEAGDIENEIHQLAQVLRNATRLRKELESNQELIEYWKEITANLLNAETSNERTKRYNRPEKDWPDV